MKIYTCHFGQLRNQPTRINGKLNNTKYNHHITACHFLPLVSGQTSNENVRSTTRKLGSYYHILFLNSRREKNKERFRLVRIRNDIRKKLREGEMEHSSEIRVR